MCPFTKWGLDFIGPVNPPSLTRHRFILTSIDYCTRWIEVETVQNCIAQVVTGFVENHIVTCFGMPFFLAYNNGTSSASLIFAQWSLKNHAIIKFSSNYYPQGNGVVEFTNKNLITVIKCLLDENPKEWHM